ncbi:hypothetical protein RYX36_023647, partial [Vicia faba]
MKSLCTLIIVVIFAITLILSLEVNAFKNTKASTYPSSSKVSKMLSSFHSLSYKQGDSKSTQQVAASLRVIPPSRPNPTQN